MELIATLDTQGARAAETFVHQGRRYLVIAQLASDMPGQPASMMLGNSDVDTLVYLWSEEAQGFTLHQRLPAHGGEDAEHWRLGDRLMPETDSQNRYSAPQFPDHIFTDTGFVRPSGSRR